MGALEWVAIVTLYASFTMGVGYWLGQKRGRHNGFSDGYVRGYDTAVKYAFSDEAPPKQ